jgi:hypothetical protein
MRFIKGAVVLGAAVSFCMADISVLVLDSLNNVPVRNAHVSLKNTPTVADSTNAQGLCTLSTGGSSIVRRSSQEIAPNIPSLSPRGELMLNLLAPANVTAKTFSAQGKLLGSMEKMLAAGNHSIAPARTHAGIYLYQVSVNGKVYTLQQTKINGKSYCRQQAPGSGFMAKVTASFPDSVVVTKPETYQYFVRQAKSVSSGTVAEMTFKLVPWAEDLPVIDNGCNHGSGKQTNELFIYNNLWGHEANPTDPVFNFYTSCPVLQAGDPVTQSCNSSCLHMPATARSSNYHYWVVNFNNDNSWHNCKAYLSIQRNYNAETYYLAPTTGKTTLTNQTVDFKQSSPHWFPNNGEHGGTSDDRAFDWACTFDCFINNQSDSNHNELMVWVDNWHQDPNSGTTRFASNVTIGGRAYNVNVNPNEQTGGTNTYMSFVPITPIQEATGFSMKDFYDYALAHNLFRKWVNGTKVPDQNPYIGQLCFGYETVCTNHYNVGFVVSNYVLNDTYGN